MRLHCTQECPTYPIRWGGIKNRAGKNLYPWGRYFIPPRPIGKVRYIYHQIKLNSRKFRQNNYLVISTVETFLSRNFCQTCVTINFFCDFHSMQNSIRFFICIIGFPIIIEHFFFHKVIKHLTIDQKVYYAKRLQIGLSALNVNTQFFLSVVRLQKNIWNLINILILFRLKPLVKRLA